MSSSAAEAALELSEEEEEWSRFFLEDIIRHEFLQRNTDVFTILSSNRVSIQREMKKLMLTEDMEQLYSENGEPNTDISTWSMRALLYFFYCVITKYLKGNICMRYTLLDGIYVQKYVQIGNFRTIGLLNTTEAVIKEFLVPQPVWEEFKKDGHLPYDRISEFEELTRTAEMNQYIIDYVKTTGEGCLSQFKMFLSKTNQPFLCSYLQRVEMGENTEEILHTLRLESALEAERRNAGKETDYYKHVLDRSVSMIKECLIPEPILDCFLEDGFLTYTDFRDIQELQTTTEKNQNIVQIVRAKGEAAYTAFKVHLLNSSQNHLCRYIINVERGEVTEELRTHLKEKIRKREKAKRKEKRSVELTEESTVNSIEENLILAVKAGKDFEGEEDIDERMSIQGSTQLKTRNCCYTIKCIFEEEMADNCSDKIVTAVNDIASMINVKVSKAVVDKDNCVVITMSCSSSEEMRTLLKTLKGEQFSTRVSKLKDALTEEYMDTFRVEAKISPEQIRLVHEHLRNQGIIEKREDVSFCGQHTDQQLINEFICPEHDVFCCDECAKTTHRKCPGLRQITEDPILEEDSNQDGDTFPKPKKEYRVRFDETDLCTTKGICILPNSEILLIDNVNNRLKKLNMLYKVAGYCELPKPPLDICLVDNFKILVSFGDTVSFVDTEGELKLQEELRLKELCYCITWHIDSIYYTDKFSLFSCDEKGNEHQVVYRFGKERITCNRIVGSNDKKKIYISAGAKGLITVDVVHKTHSTFTCEELRECTDICIVKGEHLLVCDFKSNAVYQMDVEGNKVLKKVAEKSNGLQLPRSIDFDETDSTLVVGRLGRDFISVFEIEKLVSTLPTEKILYERKH